VTVAALQNDMGAIIIAPMQTILNLLTRNGVVFMAFKPSLSAEQYARLLEISQVSENEDELRTSVGLWASREKLAVRFEE
jgi:hypothetical protein